MEKKKMKEKILASKKARVEKGERNDTKESQK